MAEARKGEKWEGPGKPEGPGGASTEPSDVEGRETKARYVACFECGALASMWDESWEWFTCWRCGTLNYVPKK